MFDKARSNYRIHLKYFGLLNHQIQPTVFVTQLDLMFPPFSCMIIRTNITTTRSRTSRTELEVFMNL